MSFLKPVQFTPYITCFPLFVFHSEAAVIATYVIYHLCIPMQCCMCACLTIPPTFLSGALFLSEEERGGPYRHN